MENNKVRTNNTWVAMVRGDTLENGENIQHDSRMVKFELPLEFRGKPFDNNKGNAIWYFQNRLDFFDTMSDDRMINANDIPEAILNLISYFSIQIAYSRNPERVDSTVYNYEIINPLYYLGKFKEEYC